MQPPSPLAALSLQNSPWPSTSSPMGPACAKAHERGSMTLDAWDEPDVDDPYEAAAYYRTPQAEKAKQICQTQCPQVTRELCLERALNEERGQEGGPLPARHRQGIRAGLIPSERYAIATSKTVSLDLARRDRANQIDEPTPVVTLLVGESA